MGKKKRQEHEKERGIVLEGEVVEA
ncbi:MAG TPA: translation initiation factor IF-1, partial [Aquificaceae bacterium]|nr:translation initiation factor IF-1 [Aquificaceae bacterium]